jgi:antitoxin component YwqK of YwqJK toxin-antitoxin module
MSNLKPSSSYDNLKGIVNSTFHTNDHIKECTISQYNEIMTPYGILVPQYEEIECRRPNSSSLSFFSNGKLKSISLQKQTTIKTELGHIPAEFITFYDSGELRRIFPLNGKLSAYWEEEDEQKLAHPIDFSFSFGTFAKKIIGIQFYKSGKIKSITFWPGEKYEVTTSQGIIGGRIGIALYESGAIKSFEPKAPTLISTPIGKITAYDINPIGVNGDVNSLCFYEDGNLQSLLTYSTKIEVVDSKGTAKTYEPNRGTAASCGEFDEVVPLKIEFSCNKVIFNSEHEYSISENDFNISKVTYKNASQCASCSGCS